MIQRIALLSVHASPLVKLGADKAGGMNVYVREIAREFGRQGIEVDVYTAGLGGNAEIDLSLGERVRVIAVPIDLNVFVDPVEFYPYLDQFVAGVLTFAKDTTYDLIYSHYWLSGWVANKLRAVWSVPFVHMFHTLGHMKDRIAIPGIGRSRLETVSVQLVFEEKIVRWADGIIAATPAEEAQLIWLYRANREKISIVSPGVDLHQFYPIEDVNFVRARLRLPQDSDVLLFVGRLEPLKAVDVVLDALFLLRAANPDLVRKLRFVVVGGGNIFDVNSELYRLKTLSVQMGLAEVVDFVGAKDQSELADFYRVSLAVVVPSDYESFGMVALEAMASGSVVIASGVGGLAYLIPDGEAGWLIPARDSRILADRLQFLLANPEIRDRLSLSAIRLAQQYSWDYIVNQLLFVFQGLVLVLPIPRRS